MIMYSMVQRSNIFKNGPHTFGINVWFGWPDSEVLLGAGSGAAGATSSMELVFPSTAVLFSEVSASIYTLCTCE
jgi:hypothetical protein